MKILLADPSEIWTDALYEQLKDRNEVWQCTDGADVIPMLLNYQPDLLLLGMELPHVDGLTLMRAIHSSGIRVKVLAAAYIFPEYDMQMLCQFEVSHFLRKPCTVCAAVSQIYQMLHFDKNSDNTGNIESTLLLLGLRMSLSGFNCLRTAIRLLRENPDQQLTKVLYPKVAKLCGGTASSVERAMRGAIEDAWLHRDDKIWMAYFPGNRKGEISQPKLGDFITRIAFGGKDNRACG